MYSLDSMGGDRGPKTSAAPASGHRTDENTAHVLRTPGQALWDQRQPLAALRSRLNSLSQAVDRPVDLSITQWVQIAAFTLDFRPDLIIELGREFGNSTCCFLEIANHLGGAKACLLLSLCLSDSWSVRTVPRLRNLVPKEWFAPADIRRVNLLDFDFKAELENCQRPLIFWDAHGFEVAECVLGSVLPHLLKKGTSRPHARPQRCPLLLPAAGIWGTGAVEG